MDVIVAIVSYLAFAVWASASLASIGLWAWVSLPESVRVALVTPRARGRLGSNAPESVGRGDRTGVSRRTAPKPTGCGMTCCTVEGRAAR